MPNARHNPTTNYSGSFGRPCSASPWRAFASTVHPVALTATKDLPPPVHVPVAYHRSTPIASRAAHWHAAIPSSRAATEKYISLVPMISWLAFCSTKYGSSQRDHAALKSSPTEKPCARQRCRYNPCEGTHAKQKQRRSDTVAVAESNLSFHRITPRQSTDVLEHGMLPPVESSHKTRQTCGSSEVGVMLHLHGVGRLRESSLRRLGGFPRAKLPTSSLSVLCDFRLKRANHIHGAATIPKRRSRLAPRG